jgi:penicillin amidase
VRLVVLCALATLCLSSACRRATPPLQPLVAQVSGTIVIDGLTAPVRVVRDTWGVPHIYARNPDDLFFAQGFVQAQDRLFQMDLWRRSAQGRLSEVLGPNFIERDAMTRRMQYRGDVAADWNSYGPDANAIARAFVRGVNAWARLARDRPPEEFVLAGWKPEEWTADDLLNRTEAFTTSGDALDEVFRARLVAAIGLARARQLLPGDRGLDGPVGAEADTVPDLVAEAIRRVGTPAFFLGLAAPVTSGTIRVPSTRETPVNGQGYSVSSSLSTTTTFDSPSLRYLVHLNAPGWNVIGATAPWRPGVAVGHNDRVSWTAEPLDADTQDVYVEKLNPADDRQVEDQGRWATIEMSKSVIAVRGRKKPVDFDRLVTRHGVVVASDRESHLAFALRWAGAEPGTASELAALTLDRVPSWPAFRAALARWKMPARRVIYADTGGVRDSAVAALVPVRRGWSGGLPVAGWAGAAEWSGWTTPNAKPTPQPSASVLTARVLLESMRLHPDRADALLQKLASSVSSRESLTSQRAAIVGALADALSDRERPQEGPVLFAHPLAVSDAARQRFNVFVPSRAKAGTFAIVSDPADWDRSTAMAAPGQSGSPDSAHFADLAKVWSEGALIPLAFSESAVNAHAEATLLLTPKP